MPKNITKYAASRGFSEFLVIVFQSALSVLTYFFHCNRLTCPSCVLLLVSVVTRVAVMNLS